VIQLNLVRSINFVITLITSPRPIPVREGEPHRPSNSSQISPELRRLCIRLAPLRQVEENLISLLSGRHAPTRRRSQSHLQDPEGDQENDPPSATKGLKSLQEVVFPSQGRWKEKFSSTRRRSEDSQLPAGVGSSDGHSRILTALTDEMVNLWEDQSVQTLLLSAEIRLDEQPGL